MNRMIVILLSLVALHSTVPEIDADEVWQAGAAKIVITPPSPMWMSGYASRSKPAESVIHDLFAKALVLQDPAGHKALVVTLDLVGIDRATSQSICEQLEGQHGLQRSDITISTSHTHSGPVVGRNLISMYSLDEQNLRLVTEYTQFLNDSILKVAAEAFSDLAPALLQHGSGQATFAVNRRNNREPDVPMLRESGQLVGPVDHDVPLLAVRAPDGRLRAVMFGYACHATVLSGMDWCGDWPGFGQLEIERRHPDTIAMFMAGCGADHNPLPRKTVELATDYGNQIADSIDRAMAGPVLPVKGTLQTSYREIDLAFDQLPSKEQIEADLKSENVYIARRAAHLLEKISRDGRLSPTYPYPVQVLRLGELQIVTLGGEVVVDYALRLKDELPGSSVWIAGYCNDVMAYIPSVRVLKEGGYEGESAMIYYGLPTKWSVDVEDHIVRTVKDLAAIIPSARVPQK
ncbi:MAG: neutral/alkaline non-lysosomal ceramidase N-terminal domain-containing protein [Planctomycetota bacterium]|nr:neutral/alkaline non-lysosomal ceramidase N-terminal domain-containing protein [Planctomycetota bacterium]